MAIELLKKLVSFESVTPEDDGALEYIRSYLSDFEAEYFNRGGVKNLYLKKRFGDGEHLCLAGHIDVVPSGDGWSSNPFEAVEKDGYIYGRGVQDMKSGVASMVESARNIENFNGTLSLLLTSDEEGEAKHGTVYVLEELKKRGDLPDYGIITEPTCEVEMGDTLKVGRRGSINGILKIIGKQGHVAYPDKHINPVHLFAEKLPLIAGKKLDSGDQFFAPSQLMVTDIRGGMEVTNVTPDSLKIMFNIRNSTATAVADVENYLKGVLSDLPYELKIEQTSRSFQTERDSKIVELTAKAVENICGVKPELSTGGGTSDARFFGEFKIPVVEFGVKNDRIHSVDERTTADEVEKLYRTVLQVLEEF
jgi:succinyl-diaminopimelate desuccinylase